MSDYEEAPKDSESLSDKEKKAKGEFVAPISEKKSYLKNISNHRRYPMHQVLLVNQNHRHQKK